MFKNNLLLSLMGILRTQMRFAYQKTRNIVNHLEDFTNKDDEHTNSIEHL